LYDEHVGTQKWTKKIGYGTQLRIDEKVVSPSRRGGGKEAGVARYELFGGEFSLLFSHIDKLVS